VNIRVVPACLALFLAAAAGARAQTTIRLDVSPVSPDGHVDVTVLADNLVGVIGVEFALTYDRDFCPSRKPSRDILGRGPGFRFGRGRDARKILDGRLSG